MRYIRGRHSDERGFTLPEVLITIAILGILVGIAFPVWQGIRESRQADSATNQLASDLRLAHNTSTNRLEPWKVKLTDDSSSYTVGPTGSLESRSLCRDGDCGGNDPEVTITGVPEGDTVTITFEPDGSASVAPTGSSTTFGVGIGGSSEHEIELTPATSGVSVDS